MPRINRNNAVGLVLGHGIPPRAVYSTQAQGVNSNYLDHSTAKRGETHMRKLPFHVRGAVYDAIIERLRGIFDPEIPVNIYDLGLIYGVEVDDNGEAVVSMTLTTPHCPVAESMPAEVEIQVGSVPGVSHAEVNLVWDPPWDPGKMSDEAKLELGML